MTSRAQTAGIAFRPDRTPDEIAPPLHPPCTSAHQRPTHSDRAILRTIGCVIILASSTTWAGIGKIHGWVRSAASGLPLEASVEILGTGTPVFTQVRGPELPPRAYVSPRLAVSHPVSQNTAIHFSTSVAHDHLPYSLLFNEYRKEGGLARLVRISQEPQRSISYDFGLQWSPIDAMTIDVNAYQKDYENYFSLDWGLLPSVEVDVGGGRTTLPVIT